jgi:replicative DNA helicase
MSPNTPSNTDPAALVNSLDVEAIEARLDELEREADARLVRRLLVAKQPVVVGGPRKVMKTSILIDLAISLGSGTPFLGEFQVYRKARVALLSGESGQAAIQSTARRVCAARGVALKDSGVLWGFQLPQLANPDHLDALRDGLKALGVEIAVIEPLYLCLLAGARGQEIDPANMFQMGPLLLSIATACLSVGCTPVLGAHSKKNLANPGGPMELEELSHSGLPEYARQWLLLSRVNPYRQGTGSHQLWLNAGGSCGQGGLWQVNIEEGALDENFGGRSWEVAVHTSEDVREYAEGARQTRQQEKDRADDAALLNALDALARDGQRSTPRSGMPPTCPTRG